MSIQVDTIDRTQARPAGKTRKIPMASPDLTNREIDRVNEVLLSRYLSIGPHIKSFEQEFASFVGLRHAIGVNSGTSGLHLSIIAANVEEGDLVITTPFSFVASANCILYEKAIPIFVDVDPRTGNIDPMLVSAAVEKFFRHQKQKNGSLTRATRDGLWPRLLPGRRRKITGRLKAILPVHIFGQPADMDPILEVAKTYGLSVIEDACEAIGSEYKGQTVGSFGDSAVFAFYPNKQITTGEGGMVVTDDDGLMKLFRSLRNQGRDVHDANLVHNRLGYNYRLDELSAALGVVQLSRIEEIHHKREKVAAWYNERLADVDGIEIPYIAPTTTRMSWFVYVIRLRSEFQRDTLMARLQEFGIPSRQYFSPIHMQPYYVRHFGYKRGDFPVTERLGETSLALPFSSVMTEDQVDYVCSHVIKLTGTVQVVPI